MNVAQRIAQELETFGVRRIYGLAGSSFLPLVEAIAERGALRFVPVAEEASAALMASAEAKLTGGLGVCLAHAGPGAAHLATGLWDAHKDRVPVLALTGQVPTAKIGTNYKQAADLTTLMAGPAGFTAQVASAEEAPWLLTEALRHALTMSDSAHLALPEDLLAQPCGTPGPISAAPYQPAAPRLDLRLAHEAAERLWAAEYPLVIMGRGARGAAGQVLALAEALQAPVITTLFAKGALAEDHPLVLGPLGEAGTDRAAAAARRADVVLLIGATWWPQAFLPQDVDVLQVDRRATAMLAVQPRLTAIVADAAEACEEIRKRLPEGRRPPYRPVGEDLGEEGEGAGIHPRRIMREFRDAVPEGAVICVDTGLDTLWYGRAFQARSETTLVSGRWRTMGFALPAAIAAKLSRPDAPVVAIAGDGGFLTSMQEFATAVREGLALTVLLLRNGTLGEEQARQVVSGFGGQGLMRVATPDFVRFAQAMGGEGRRARTVEELRHALREAAPARRPMLIDVDTALVWPRTLQPVAGALG